MRGRLAIQPKEPLPSRAASRLTVLCVFFALASLVWGYNIGVMATIYVHPGFKEALHKPDSSTTGLITSIYYLGTWLSYLFVSHPTADQLGRRAAAAIGILVTAVGAALQTGAGGPNALAMMIIGRIICGFGLGIVSTSVPLYQSEVAPAKSRGRYVVINHIGLVAGLSIAFWVGYGVSHWESPSGHYYGWRLSMAVQFIPSLIFLLGVFFCPETPRWLVEKGRTDEARKTLAWLRSLEVSDDVVVQELQEMEHDIEQRRLATNQSWTMLFTHRPLFNRLWRAALLHFMGQMCGNTSMKYYLPSIFMSLGIERKLALMIGGIESTLKIGCTIFDSMIVDKAGRRLTLFLACVVMSISLFLNGLLPQIYPHNQNHAADYVCIIFIFFYTFGYSIGFGPAAWVYGSEIFPTNFRAKGLNIAASGGSIGSIMASQIWPIGMARIGSRTHFIFMSTNIASAVIIWFFYPETMRRSLEDMDALFDPSFQQNSQRYSIRRDSDLESDASYENLEEPEGEPSSPNSRRGQTVPLLGRRRTRDDSP